jgi:AcrR family transcriptional regulator
MAIVRMNELLFSNNMVVTTTSAPGLRARRKAETRGLLQSAALRLFVEQGFDATSVSQIAEEVGVSHMTFYRYFPSKESVVLDDDYDPLIAEVIAAQPRDLPPVERVRRALGAAMPEVFAADRDRLRVRVGLILATPSLRARYFEQSEALVALIAEALSRTPRSRKPSSPTFATRVVAAACAAAMTTAVLIWGERGGTGDLPRLMDEAFVALATECGR